MYQSLCNRFGKAGSLYGMGYFGIPTLTLAFNALVNPMPDPGNAIMFYLSGMLSSGVAILSEVVLSSIYNYSNAGKTMGMSKKSDLMQKVQLGAYGVSHVAMCSFVQLHADKFTMSGP